MPWSYGHLITPEAIEHSRQVAEAIERGRAGSAEAETAAPVPRGQLGGPEVGQLGGDGGQGDKHGAAGGQLDGGPEVGGPGREL